MELKVNMCIRKYLISRFKGSNILLDLRFENNPIKFELNQLQL